MGLKAFNKWGLLILYPKTSTQDNKQLVIPFGTWSGGSRPSAPNIMKGINIFTADVIKDFPYNYDKIIQVLWKKKGNKKKIKIFMLKLFENDAHMALWNFRLCFEPSGLPPLNKLVDPFCGGRPSA
jgi:hypothetical protein